MTSGPSPKLSDNPIGSSLILNPAEAKQRPEFKRYRLNGVQIPALRVFGMFLLLILVGINDYDLNIFSWTTLHFKLTDTGIGIPAARRELIFQPFSQVDGSSTRQYGGSGIGLPLSERLAGLMDGRIRLEIEEGKASTFHFTAGFKPHTRRRTHGIPA